MLRAWDVLFCQMFHASYADVVSYSRQGAWRCTKPGCRAQRMHDARPSATATRPRAAEPASTDVPAAAFTPHLVHKLESDGGVAAD